MSRLAKTLLDIEFDSIKEFKVWDILNLKKYKEVQGCYVFFDIKGNALYVGESNNIYSRIRKHIRGSNQTGAIYKYFYSVKLYKISTQGIHRQRESYYERKLLEQYLIRKLKPIRNDVKNGFLEHKVFMDYTRNHFKTHITNWSTSEQTLYKNTWPKIDV